MRKVIQEPGFWLMVFGIIMFTLLLYAPDGRCESPADRMLPFPIVSQEYGPLTYIIIIKDGCTGNGIGFSSRTNCETKYHHLIGPTGQNLALVDITDRMPTAEVLRSMLFRYIMTITGGV